MARFVVRLSLGLVVIGLRQGVSAQQTYSWQQLRDRFRANNPTLQAARINIDESRAQEVTAFLRPNPDLTVATDGTQLTPSQGVWRPFAGTQFGATAVSQCAGLSGLGAKTIVYYLYSSPAALASGISSLLSSAHFRKSQECTTGGEFTEFLINCQSDFRRQAPSMTGTIAEYPNTSHEPIIVTSDDHQNVMVVMIGTNARDLLAYWNQLNWIVR